VVRRLQLLQADIGRHPRLTSARLSGFGPFFAGAVTLVLLTSPGCGVRGLDFRQDKRLTITAPGDRAKVHLPVTVTWRVHDFDVTGRDGERLLDSGYFGVFVDRAPQPPERTLQWLVRDDPSCSGIPSCPDEEFLAERNIHATNKTRFTIERLAAPTTNAAKRREFHEVTIVLLNGRGERIGESAFTIQFEVAREV
jgi:hypothetical protein